MTKRILIADDEPSVCRLLELVLRNEGYEVETAHNGDQLVRQAQEHVPDLLLIDLMMPQLDGYEAIRQLRNDTRTAHLPMLILTAKSAPTDLVTGFETGADDYITKPFILPELLARIKGHLRRASQRSVNNPLSGLPGNVLLSEEIKYRLKRDEPFAMLYIDLDNFKAFNDIYGPSRGDRAIKLLADVIVEAVAQYGSGNDFIGHIGGDDFAVITMPDVLDRLCKGIIASFDARVRLLYDADDLARGYLRSVDRQGVPRDFPIMAISIGGVTNRQRQFKDDEEVSRVAAEVKSFAKTKSGSSYVVDARSNAQPPVAIDRRGAQLPVVLLVSNDLKLNNGLQTALNKEGYRVLQAPSVLDANTVLAREPKMRLLVADARLGQPLWDLAEHMRDSASPKLMVVTRSEKDERAGRAHGVNTFIQQPFAVEAFLKMVRDVIRR